VTARTDRVAPARASPLHPLSRRIMHWINALAILVMIGSGWRIYNYYPALPIDFGFP
jgi:thiosulfate reductase cytochrome b subunit